MACLDNIVTLGYCDDVQPTSGLTLIQAGGMNIKNFANIASDSSGIDMVNEKKQLAITLVKNDFNGAIARANVIPQVTNRSYDAAYFKPTTNVGSSASGRGLILHKANGYRGVLRDTKITGVEIFPMTTGSGTLRIEDGDKLYSWPIQFDGGVSNFYDHTQLDGFPYVMQSSQVKILVIADGINFSSSYITCKTGCHGAPNPCGWLQGWDGSKRIKSEGYGVNVTFEYICDYDKILCASPGIIGELIWLKWQILIYDEHYKSNRFNGFVTYNKDTINEVVMPDLTAKYTEKWGDFTATLPSLLNQYRDDCLNCRGLQWKVNI